MSSGVENVPTRTPTSACTTNPMGHSSVAVAHPRGSSPLTCATLRGMTEEEFSADEICRFLRMTQEGDNEMGNADLMDELERRGLIRFRDAGREEPVLTAEGVAYAEKNCDPT